MKMYRILSLIVLFLGGSFSQTYAQHSGDEQGMEIPEGLDLKEDAKAFYHAKDGWWTESMKNKEKRMEWYRQAKFGCFIHWGPSSVPAGIWKGKRMMGYTEHLMRRECISIPEYKKEVVEPFNPTEMDPKEWMKYVHEAGMKFFIITAKHHDGFAMYPSDAYPFDIRQTQYKGENFMMQLRKEARKYGIKFGFYYSHAFDWEHPDAPGNDWDFKDHPGGDKQIGGRNWWRERPDFLPHAEKYVMEKSLPQVQELIKKYDPDIMWFDTPHKLPMYLNIRILEAIREVDPENKIVVNGRLARFADVNMGDYENTGDRAAYYRPFAGDWEAIPTTNESYGYSAVDTVRKSVPFFVKLITSAVAKGGNILLNVGPMGNGAWDYRDVAVLKGIGDWMKVNGNSLYGTHKTGLALPSWGVTTQKGDTLYAHVYDWPDDGRLVLGGLRSTIKSISCLSDEQMKISYSRLNADDYVLNLPTTASDNRNSVLAIVLQNQVQPNPIRLLDDRRSNILYTFDSELQGEGLGYADGKPNRNCVVGWKKTSQWMKWTFRLNEKASYKVYLDYNTQGDKTGRGLVSVAIGGKTFQVAYGPYTEEQGTNSIYVGDIELKQGVSECALKGIDYTGPRFMSPIAIRLIKK